MKNSKRKFLLSLILLGISVNALAANNDEWWEYTTQMDGMGGISMPAQKDCYRKGNIAPSSGAEDNDCTQSNLKFSGNKSSQDFACKDGTTGHMEGTQTGKESSFKMTSKSKDGQTFTMTSKGKMVGNCNWETDSSEAKACGQLNKVTKDVNTDNAKNCEEAYREDRFYEFFGGQKSGDSVALAGKKCGGTMTTGCAEKRPQMCAKVQNYLKDNTGEASGYLKVAKANRGPEFANACNAGYAAATKQFCADRLKTPINGSKGSQALTYCAVEAKALRAKHCVGRDYTAEASGPYGGLCGAAPIVDSSGSSNGSTSNGASTNGSPNGDSSSSNNTDSTKGNTNPVDGAIKGVKKLKDVFGF